MIWNDDNSSHSYRNIIIHKDDIPNESQRIDRLKIFCQNNKNEKNDINRPSKFRNDTDSTENYREYLSP